jgi:benzoylformate decarboxylase
LNELADALHAAMSPAFVVGPAVDASGAAGDVVTLAERTGAVVWASPMSHRCSFPEGHSRFAGFLPPAREQLTAALSRHDLVVVLGAPVFTYHVGTAQQGGSLPTLYVVNDDEQALAWAENGTAIRADVRIAVRQLLPLARSVDRPGPPPRTMPAAPTATTPMSGAYVYSTVAQVLPADAVVVEEAPSHRNDLHTYLPIARSGGFLTMATGVLGFGLPAAVGVALAQPDRPVLAVLGDGSAMYGIQGLWTAVRENARVTFVILDNGGYGALVALGRASGIEKFPGADLGGIDFCALARGMGCPARLVESPADLTPALHEALATDGPVLLHVVVDADVAPLYDSTTP